MIDTIKESFIGALVLISSWFGQHTPIAIPAQPTPLVENVGAYGTTGGGTYRLKASIGSSDTSISLSSFKEPVSDLKYTMSYLNTTVGFGTIDPQTTRPEFISFSGITQNTDGSATLTGVTRGLTKTPQGVSCTASTTLAIRHPGQSIFILSDSPCHFAEYAVKRNDETITGDWKVGTPITGTSIVNKDFVTGLVNGGTVSTDRVVVAGTAGETFIAGSVVFFDRFQAEWMRTDADFASTTENILVGIAQGTGTDGVAISGGVLIHGLDTTQASMTAGNRIYISGTIGATSTSPGTFKRQIAVVRSATTMYVGQNIDLSTIPSFTTVNATSTNATTTNLKVSGEFNLATSSTAIYGSGYLNDIGKHVQLITASSTWTKPLGVTRIKLTLIGGGGGGGDNAGTTPNPGGGSGAVCIAYIDVTATTTVNVYIGFRGYAVADGAGVNGADSFFSSYCRANGGEGGPTGGPNVGGNGGTSTLGDINLTGEQGGMAPAAGGTQSIAGDGGSTPLGWGIGGRGSYTSDVGKVGTGYGAGGGGANNSGGAGNGTTGAAIIEW